LVIRCCPNGGKRKMICGLDPLKENKSGQGFTGLRDFAKRKEQTRSMDFGEAKRVPQKPSLHSSESLSSTNRARFADEAHLE